MFDTKYLLEAIDNFTLSVKDRLNANELQLLNDIRAGIAENQNQKEVEEYFFTLLNFLLMLKEYFDNIT